MATNDTDGTENLWVVVKLIIPLIVINFMLWFMCRESI